MNRFPEKYVKPEAVSLDEGLNRGWTAECVGFGNSPSTGVCQTGMGFSETEKMIFVHPDVMRQMQGGSSGILSDTD